MKIFLVKRVILTKNPKNKCNKLTLNKPKNNTLLIDNKAIN